MNVPGTVRISAVMQSLFAAFLLAACADSSTPEKAPPDILLLTIDTTRAEALGCYGGQIAKTPALDALARRGILFETAVAPVSATLPTHTTLMTGLWPFAHGVRDNGIFRLSPRATTMAELFAQAGYTTGAVVSAFVLDSQFGLDQGFNLYDDQVNSRVWLAAGLQDRRAEAVTTRALKFLDENAEEPTFLWLHYFDPHSPYTPPAPFAEQYRKHPYQGEIAYMDSQIGRLVDGLRGRGRLDGTLIVVVADHGESLGRHGEETHGYFIYDATVRVPLLVSGPGLPAGRRIGGSVRVIDVMPTILELAGLQAPASLQGRSLTPFMSAGSAVAPDLTAYLETYVPYYNFGWCPLQGLRTSRWKFIRAPQPELYDLTADPLERRNVIEGHPDVAARLRNRLEEIQRGARNTLAETIEVSSSEAEILAGLGYTAAAADPPDFTGPDPKDVIHLLAHRRRGRELLERRRFGEAIEELRKVLDENPENAQVRGFVGAALAAQGRWAEARDELSRAVASRPSLYTCQYTLGLCYGKLGEREAMRRHLLAALAHNHSYIEPARDLAVMFAEEGREREADYYLGLCRTILAERPREREQVEKLVRQAAQRARIPRESDR